MQVSCDKGVAIHIGPELRRLARLGYGALNLAPKRDLVKSPGRWCATRAAVRRRDRGGTHFDLVRVRSAASSFVQTIIAPIMPSTSQTGCSSK